MRPGLSPAEIGEATRSREGQEQERCEGPRELLRGAGEADHGARGGGATRAGEKHGSEHHRHEHEVVRAEDLVPVHERVEGSDPRRGQAQRAVCGQAAREDDGERVEEERHEARVERRAEAARDEVERGHHQVGPGQVGVVVEDGVLAPRVPEARGARLPAQHRAGVVGAVGGLAGQDPVEGQGELDDAPVLSVWPAGGEAHGHERRARSHDQDESGRRDHPRPLARVGPPHGEHHVEKCNAHRGRGEEEGHGIAVEVGSGTRPEGGEGGRHLGKARVVQEAPGQDARRIVECQVARDQEEEGGNDGRVRRETEGGGQPTSRGSVEGSTRAPHEQTRLRTAHSIFSRRPHTVQPR